MQWWNRCERSTCVLNQLIRPSCWTRCLGQSGVGQTRALFTHEVRKMSRLTNGVSGITCDTLQCERWYHRVSAFDGPFAQVSISSDCRSVYRSREQWPVVRREPAYEPKGLIILRHKCIPSYTLSVKPICHSVVDSSCIVICEKENLVLINFYYCRTNLQKKKKNGRPGRSPGRCRC